MGLEPTTAWTTTMGAPLDRVAERQRGTPGPNRQMTTTRRSAL